MIKVPVSNLVVYNCRNRGIYCIRCLWKLGPVFLQRHTATITLDTWSLGH